jgi:hypothetical protein
MSYQEKRILSTMLTNTLILAAYCIYAFGQYQSGAAAPDDLNFWAITMLKFIGIGIVAAIVIQIVFHVLLSVGIAVRETIQNGEGDNEKIDRAIKAEMVEDELDKLIGMKTGKISIILAGIGFGAGLISLAFGQPAFIMLNILFIAFSAGSIVEGIAQLVYYRKGVRNG